MIRILVVAAFLAVLATLALTSGSIAAGGGNCQYAEFEGYGFRGVVKVCNIDTSDGYVKAVINGSRSGILGLCNETGYCGARNPVVSSFHRGHNCLKFDMTWPAGIPLPNSVVLRDANFINTLAQEPLTSERLPRANMLNACQR